MTFILDPTQSIDEQNDFIREKMKDDLISHYRQEALNEFVNPDEEELDYEEFKFYTIREATRWSDLEDFTFSS